MHTYRRLTVDPAMGMAGDMFAAALLGLAVPQASVTQVMELAAKDIGGATVTVHREKAAPGKPAFRLATHLSRELGSISISRAFTVLEKTIKQAGIQETYARFATRALTILAEAEIEAHRLLDSGGHAGNAKSPTSRVSTPEVAAVTHEHGIEAHLHEAQDIVMDVAAAAWGLQYLTVDLANVRSTEPVMTGRGTVSFSHGVLHVPAPATRVILDRFSLPWSFGPMDFEQLTPTGAAILAALNPTFMDRREVDGVDGERGHGLGTKRSDPPNLLTLVLEHGSQETEKAEARGLPRYRVSNQRVVSK
jgi:uncharacterized protein (DUF111 family)